MSINNDKKAFEDAIRTLKGEIANMGAHMVIESSVRQAYARQIQAMSHEMQIQVRRGILTWKQAAEQANEVRNIIMESMRFRSTPVGRAVAVKLKAQGKTLNEVIAKKTMEKFGKSANFNNLNPAQQNTVFAEVVKSAGKDSPRVSSIMKNLSKAGRGLVFLSLAISVYSIATADDKITAAKHEATIAGSGFAGGVAGGALAGLVCGPGAPVCVTIGAFVGGALAAFGVSYFW